MTNQENSMNKPSFIIKHTDRTKSGALSTSNLQKIRQQFLWRGMILLPSDTCYSIASMAEGRDTYDRINLLLNRNKELESSQLSKK